MTMLYIHVAGLYFIGIAILAVAAVIWHKDVSITIEPDRITVVPAPVEVRHIWHPQQGGAVVDAPAVPSAPIELLKDGRHLGWRHAEHPDIEEAIATPGLSVRYPDGTVVGAE